MPCNDSFYGLNIDCDLDNIYDSLYNSTKDEQFHEEHSLVLAVTGGSLLIGTILGIIYRYRGFLSGVSPPGNRI